jgi:hypothetical protein
LQFPKDNYTGLVVVESIAALRAIIFAKVMGWNKVELEGNALQVVQTLWKEGQN